MKRVLLLAAVMTVFLLMPAMMAMSQGYPWDEVVFDSESRAWDASRLKLVLENDGTMTAFVLVRDVYVYLDNHDVRASWKGHPQMETSFNGLVQTRGASTDRLLEKILAYDRSPGQLAGLFWASDLTGWELTNLRDHDSEYVYEAYTRILAQGTPVEREEVMFVLRGIPVSNMIHGQFILLYPGNPDGTTDHVWLNPGFMDYRDHDTYWVRDCQDEQAEGEIINGEFVGRVFHSIPVPCSW